MAMLTMNATTARNHAYVPPYETIYAPPPLQGFQQQSSYPSQGSGHSGRLSPGGHTHCKRGGRGRSAFMPPPPVPYVGGIGIIPYIPAGIQPPVLQPAPHFSKIIKVFANQNVCFLCGFNVEDLHMSIMCNCRKPGHQDGFTRSNYMEYAHANYPFCRKAMHKTMYPSSFWWCGMVSIGVNSLKSVTQYYSLYPTLSPLCLTSTHCAKDNKQYHNRRVKFYNVLLTTIHRTPPQLPCVSPRHIVHQMTMIKQSLHQIALVQSNIMQMQCRLHQLMRLQTLALRWFLWWLAPLPKIFAWQQSPFKSAYLTEQR